MTDAYRRKAANFVNGSGLSSNWNKLFHLKEALRDAPPDAWVLWVDSDVVFMNPALPLEAVLSRGSILYFIYFLLLTLPLRSAENRRAKLGSVWPLARPTARQGSGQPLRLGR